MTASSPPTRHGDALRELLAASLDAVRPERRLPGIVAEMSPCAGRTFILGAGKAAAPMAACAAQHYPHPYAGLVVTRYGYGDGITVAGIDIVRAAHPVPDRKGISAGRAVFGLARDTRIGDRVIFLASGGGSSLLVRPLPGLTLEEKRNMSRFLLDSGAAIGEINIVRKHLSGIKGGRLAAAAQPAEVITLAISDVPGDDPSMIASGPTVPDSSTQAEARDILARYEWPSDPRIASVLSDPACETPGPDAGWASPDRIHVVAKAADALSAAENFARERGWRCVNLGDRIEGEARTVGQEHVRRALSLAGGEQPLLLVSGGELTVRIGERAGRGGPNLEYLLGILCEMSGGEDIHALACDTDGIDGSSEHAGAVLGPDTRARASALGLDARQALDSHESFGFFDALDDLVVTGPTGTNVSDFRAILVVANSKTGAGSAN